MYKVDGLFNSPLRRKRRELDFRVPEDRLAVEDGVQIIHSPEVGRWDRVDDLMDWLYD